MTDLNIGKAADLGLQAAETLKKGLDSIGESIEKSAKNSLAGKVARLVEQIKENGLQETAEDIIDDIKDFTERISMPFVAKIGYETGKELGENPENGPFTAAKIGVKKALEAAKERFSDK